MSAWRKLCLDYESTNFHRYMPCPVWRLWDFSATCPFSEGHSRLCYAPLQLVKVADLLVEHFLGICTEKFQKQVNSVSPTLMTMFKRYAWDGNVRELMKVIEMGVINARDSIITEKEISCFTENMMNGQEVKDDDLAPASKVTDEDIKYWMEKLNYNKSKVARRLGVSYRTILRRSKLIDQQIYP